MCCDAGAVVQSPPSYQQSTAPPFAPSPLRVRPAPDLGVSAFAGCVAGLLLWGSPAPSDARTVLASRTPCGDYSPHGARPTKPLSSHAAPERDHRWPSAEAEARGRRQTRVYGRAEQAECGALLRTTLARLSSRSTGAFRRDPLMKERRTSRAHSRDAGASRRLLAPDLGVSAQRGCVAILLLRGAPLALRPPSTATA